MTELLDVVSVVATADCALELVFENGEHRRFDMSALLTKKPFIALAGNDLFFKAYVQAGTVAWPGDIDIAPETLYERSVPLSRTS